jgi:hypothetical protein
MNMNITRSKTTSLLLSSLLLLSGSLALGSAMVVAPLGNQPATAGGFGDWLKDKIPAPTGIYFEINGKKFYFGDYSADPTLAYPGSKWEVKVNHRISAHGYGETPGWVVESAKKLFGFK